MKCLCCGKPINQTATDQEKINGWHKICVKHFFGTNQLPNIDLSVELLEQLADESTNHGFTVPGVQKKLSLNLLKEENPRLTLVNYPTGYILKPQSPEYPALPEMECLSMRMAQSVGIKTVPFALIKMHGQAQEVAYITKRIDRIEKESDKTGLLAMEDFCQLDERLTEDKYKGSYERCGKIISRYSNRPGLDLSELYYRLVFSFLTGNSDMHLKNFSLIETEENANTFVLSPAYDFLPVNIILPQDQEEFALTMRGKKKRLKYADFIVFAETIGLNEKSAKKMIRRLLSMKDHLQKMVEEALLPENYREGLIQLLNDRTKTLLDATD